MRNNVHYSIHFCVETVICHIAIWNFSIDSLKFIHDVRVYNDSVSIIAAIDILFDCFLAIDILLTSNTGSLMDLSNISNSSFPILRHVHSDHCDARNACVDRNCSPRATRFRSHNFRYTSRDLNFADFAASENQLRVACHSASTISLAYSAVTRSTWCGNRRRKRS
jgi:hypothetical protein